MSGHEERRGGEVDEVEGVVEQGGGARAREPRLLTHEEERPWGRFELLVQDEPCTVKLLHVRAGSRLSRQRHRQRGEAWLVLSGEVDVELDGALRVLGVGERVEVPVGRVHRLGSERGAVLLEVAFGLFDEADIERIEDDHGRAAAS